MHVCFQKLPRALNIFRFTNFQGFQGPVGTLYTVFINSVILVLQVKLNTNNKILPSC